MKSENLRIKLAHNVFRAREIAKGIGIEKLQLTKKDMELLYELGEYGIMYSEDANAILSPNLKTGGKRKSRLRSEKIISGKNGINFLGPRGRTILEQLGYTPRTIQTKDKEPSRKNNKKADYYRAAKYIRIESRIKPRYIIHEEVRRVIHPEKKEHVLWRHEIDPSPQDNYVLYYAHAPILDDLDKTGFEYYGGNNSRSQFKEMLVEDVQESLGKFRGVKGVFVLVKGKVFLEEIIEKFHNIEFDHPVFILEETKENMIYLSRALDGYLKLPMKAMDYNYLEDYGDQDTLIYGVGDTCYCDNTITDIANATKIANVIEEMRWRYPKAKQYVYYTSSKFLKDSFLNNPSVTYNRDLKIVYVPPDEVQERQRERIETREFDDWQGYR